jgi:hypothetical protein
VRFTKVWQLVLIGVFGSGVAATLKGDIFLGMVLFVFCGLILWLIWVR